MGLTHFPHGIHTPLIVGGSGAGSYMTTGNVFFVDSGSSSGGDSASKGASPDTPFLTIDYAVGRATANNGDIIYVMPGHAENIVSATSLVIDTAGLRIIGLGIGRNRPRLTFTATAGSVEMDAANCWLENIVFISSISAVVVGINVNADDCSIVRCEFDYDATGDDFITLIDVDAVSRFSMLNCRVIAENGVTGMAEAVRLDTANEAVIRANDFTGDFTDGVIVLEGAASNSVDISDNRMWNGHANGRYVVNSVASQGLFNNNTQGFDDAQAHAGQLLSSLGGGMLNWQIAVHRSSPFTGASANQHGNNGGTNDPYTLFTVTGDLVIAGFWGVINTNLAGATATVEVGVPGNTAAILAQELATDMLDGGLYVSTTVAAGIASLPTSGAWQVINDGADIIETVNTSNVTAGQIDYYCIWAPVEDGARLISAAAVI